ncbi:MAG: hypothetical protein BWK76_27330 [Desulfobulbaceae bacterium A2]|nr:MAG: hypothetical protein BWK76_27330 [Desulfobulbaceae bacterium A2]
MDISLIPPLVARLDQISPYGGEQRAWRPPFQIGQFVQGLVQGTTDDGRFILDIAEQRFTAASNLPLVAGSRLDLQITATNPQMEMRVVSDPLAQRIGGSLYLLPRMEELLPLLQTLANDTALLDALPADARQFLSEWLSAGQSLLQSGNQGAALQHLLGSLGMGQEKLLAQGRTDESVRLNLKHILLTAAALPQLTSEQRETAASLVQLIDLMQLLSLRLDSANLLFFPLLLPFLEQGYLLVDHDAEGQGSQDDDKKTRYSLLLRLGGLGNLRVDLVPAPEGLVITFFCEDPDKARFMAGFREELLAGLSTTVRGISFLTGAQDPVQQLLLAGTDDMRQLLDTKA